MRNTIATRNHVYEMHQDRVEVTSMNRPDTNWYFVDAKGHMHQWWEWRPFRPAGDYSPSRLYIVPSIRWVPTGEFHWSGDDVEGEGVPVTEPRCIYCREVVRPGRMADPYRVFVPGQRSLYIDGVGVSKEEFIRRALEDGFPASTFESDFWRK